MYNEGEVMGVYEPPFRLNEGILSLLAEVCELVGQVEVAHREVMTVHLRRENQIRSIHSSLAIEHNSLTLEQVTAILDGKRVLGPAHEIREVQNAAEAYAMMQSLNPLRGEDLLKAHRLMMNTLVREAGRYRSGGVGVMAGNQVIHMAPPAHLVPYQVQDLLTWYEKSLLHPLIKSAVFHYEFEFIHPFADGNGRMGRMWHTLLLAQWRPFFAWLPIEELVARRQKEYYQALQVADSEADCECFVRLMMEVIRDVLRELAPEVGGREVVDDRSSSDQVVTKLSASEREAVEALLGALGGDVLTARELMGRMGLRHRTHFRRHYLLPALAAGKIVRTLPDKINSPRQRYQRRFGS